MNIHKFLFLPLLLTAVTIMADPVIRVVQSGAEDQSFAADQVRKLVLTETAVDVVNNAGTLVLTVPVSDIVRVEFAEGTPTAIDQTSQELSVKSEKFIRDGQLFIRHQGTIYNIQGQIIQQ